MDGDQVFDTDDVDVPPDRMHRSELLFEKVSPRPFLGDGRSLSEIAPPARRAVFRLVGVKDGVAIYDRVTEWA